MRELKPDRGGWANQGEKGNTSMFFLFILNYRTMGTIYSQIICHTIECLRCYFFHNIILFVHLVYFFVCRKQSFVRIIQVLVRNNQNCLFHIKRKLFNNVIQT